MDKPKDKCTICNGSGYVEIMKMGESYMKICECKRNEMAVDTFEKKVTEARIPIDYKNYTFEGYLSLPFELDIKESNKKNVVTIEKIISNPDYFRDNFKMLWLWGPDYNSGHTALAIIMAKALINHGFNVRFITMQNLVKLMTKFEDKIELEKLQKFDVYVVDDAFDVSRTFISTGSNFVKISLFDFFSSALADGKKFICTSNTSSRSISDEYKDIKFLLSRYAYDVELKGDLSTKIRTKIKAEKK